MRNLKKQVVMAASLILSLSSIVVWADNNVDAVISTQKEEGLEADHETMQIRDLEAEEKNAKEQAAMQGQMSQAAKTRLDNVKLKKQETQSQAQKEIALYEGRRQEAEKLNKAYTAEINKLSADVKKLEDSMNKAKQAAKDAEGIASAGREELKMIQDRKTKIENDNRQAIYVQAQTEAELARLKQNYAQASQNLKDLEQRLVMNQADAKKKLAMKAQMTQDLVKIQTRTAQVRQALGMKPTSVVAQAPTTPTKSVVSGAIGKNSSPEATTAMTPKDQTSASVSSTVNPPAPEIAPTPGAAAQPAPQAPAASVDEDSDAALEMGGSVPPAAAAAVAPAPASVKNNPSMSSATLPPAGSQVAWIPKAQVVPRAPALSQQRVSESMPAGSEIQTIDMKSGKTCDSDRNCQ